MSVLSCDTLFLGHIIFPATRTFHILAYHILVPPLTIQVGTMFATQSHPGKVPEGVGMLNNVRRQLQAEGFVDVLVIGVGGIEASNCGKVVEAGGDGVAAIRCLCLSSDAEGEARHIMGELKRGGSTDSGCGVVVGDKR